MINVLKSQIYLRSRDKIYIFIVIGAIALITISTVIGNISIASLSSRSLDELSMMFETPFFSYDDFIKVYSPILFINAMSAQSMLPWICSIFVAYFFSYEIEFRRIDIPILGGSDRRNVFGAYSCFYIINIILVSVISYIIALTYLRVRWTSISFDLILRVSLLRLLLDLSIGGLYTVFAFALKKALPTLAISIIFTYVMSKAPVAEGNLLYYYPTNIQMDQRFWLMPGSNVYLAGVVFSFLLFFVSIILSITLFNKIDLK